MNKDGSLKTPDWIESEWIDLIEDKKMIEKYIRYVVLWEYDDEFLDYLEDNEKCRKAVELALKRHRKDLKRKIKTFKKKAKS